MVSALGNKHGQEPPCHWGSFVLGRNHDEQGLAFPTETHGLPQLRGGIAFLDDRHVVLTGDNGSGKTNLLEAVSFLSPGRGLRRAVLSDVTRVGAQATGFSIFADVDGMDGEVAIGTGIEGDGEVVSRRLRLNGTAVKSVDELTDHLRVLWLTPAMDGLLQAHRLTAGVSLTDLCYRLIPPMVDAPAILTKLCVGVTDCFPRAVLIRSGWMVSKSRWLNSASPWRLPVMRCSACSGV